MLRRGVGLSPRVRGNRGSESAISSANRSIPACAGEPPGRRSHTSPARVYPRVCGGTHRSRQFRHDREGLSPRVRGNRSVLFAVIILTRSIPACAGEPVLSEIGMQATGVYPRVCGGTARVFVPPVLLVGLSPRVRGNLSERPHLLHRCRSIPACAGEPTGAPHTGGFTSVYPRVCGGTVLRVVRGAIRAGLSPRVRGNHIAGFLDIKPRRSIPACAGEPPGVGRLGVARPVYPRVCGGTGISRWPTSRSYGLSPRVRGNLTANYRRMMNNGSIPACAGEPCSWSSQYLLIAVYPRVCGGTCFYLSLCSNGRGLSPRVRGNHSPSSCTRSRFRSIPACAGEPRLATPPWPRGRVYPRVCGGTTPNATNAAVFPGLSPRVRGNPRCGEDSSQRLGSIPACAGEPPASSAAATRCTVYPRVCGGTYSTECRTLATAGLSPRVRGNLSSIGLWVRFFGSIPACAGEPRKVLRTPRSYEVYPRVCGGTRKCDDPDCENIGLSPRVRGNPVQPLANHCHCGSIPACAGEPCTPSLRLLR